MQRLNPQEPSVKIAVSVPQSTAAKIRAKADAKGETVSAWLRRVVEANVAR